MAVSSTTTWSFPPNLEDGELWLPSYICHEISLPNNDNTTTIATPQPFSRHFQPNKKAKEQMCNAFHDVKPNEKPNIVNVQPCVNHAYDDPFLNSSLQFVPETFYSPNPITSPNQFLVHNCEATSGKSKGTGVFIPRLVKKPIKIEDNIGQVKGTGVFLNHQVMVKHQKSGEAKKGGFEKKSSMKMEIRAKTQDPADQICLPQEWSY